MRAAVVLTALLLGGCASEKLALAPPAGVDLSGHWKLNEAESDDPQRLLNPNTLPGNPNNIPGQSQGPQGGGGGGRGGGRGRGGPGGPGGFSGPPGGSSGPTASPATIAALGEGLRWPGKDVEVKQVAGVVAFTSGGRNRVYTPSDVEVKPQPGKKKGRGDDRDDDTDELGPLRAGANAAPAPVRPGDVSVDETPATAPTTGSGHGPGGPGGPGGGPGDGGGPGGPGGRGRGRAEAPVSACGWEGRTLVVQVAPARDDRSGGYEQRYLLSDDGDRLIEVVARKGNHGEGFTLSRVWDRVVPGAAAAAPAALPGPPAGLGAPNVPGPTAPPPPR